MRASPDSSEQRSLPGGPSRLSTSGESATVKYPGATSFWTTERRNLNLGVLKARVRCEGWVFFLRCSAATGVQNASGEQMVQAEIFWTTEQI